MPPPTLTGVLVAPHVGHTALGSLCRRTTGTTATPRFRVARAGESPHSAIYSADHRGLQGSELLPLPPGCGGPVVMQTAIADLVDERHHQMGRSVAAHG